MRYILHYNHWQQISSTTNVLKHNTEIYHFGEKTELHTVVNVWNSLPDYVVEADSLNAFKIRLDKYWTNQDVVYDYKSDLTGTGGLPVCA